MNDNTFSVYQIPYCDGNQDILLAPYNSLTAAGRRVDKRDYAHAYTAPLEKGVDPEDIFTWFNATPGFNVLERALSVSDVIVLRRNGEEKAYYVDTVGYVEVPWVGDELPVAVNPDPKHKKSYDERMVEFSATVKMLNRLIEKQQAKKLIQVEPTEIADCPHEHWLHNKFLCPICGELYRVDDIRPKYCIHCGQKLDWSNQD